MLHDYSIFVFTLPIFKTIYVTLISRTTKSIKKIPIIFGINLFWFLV